jgi:hypothetical protein
MRKAFVAALFCWLTAAAYAAPQGGFLPREFAGWQKNAVSGSGANPVQADPANAALLQEYGFSDYEQAVYTRPDRKMTVKAARFGDTSGAYGAFTFYEQPQMLAESIGGAGASAGTRILFYRGNVLVDATLDRVTAMSAAELRELAAALPLVRGNALNPPNLPAYLPKQAAIRNSLRYVVGPVGLSDIGSPLPAGLVKFNSGAEVAVERYHTDEGEATMMVIGYPTPQIAGERQRAIEADLGGKNAGGGAGVYSKRTGPYVVVAAGQISAAEAKTLLASVNYDADVTWNENTFFGKRDNLGGLLVGVILLAAILMGAALILGIFFGGFRLLMKRMFPDRIFDRSKDVEIISLRLGE